MKIATELTLFLKNRPGVLAAVCEDLAEEGINLEAISVVDHLDHALVRLVLRNHAKATRILEAAGTLVIATEVLQLDVPNRPGALGEIAARLARAKVNIDYLYATASSAKKTRLILRVSDLTKARRALAKRR